MGLKPSSTCYAPANMFDHWLIEVKYRILLAIGTTIVCTTLT